MAYEELMLEGTKKVGIHKTAKILRVSQKTVYAYQENRGPDQTQCSNPIEKLLEWLTELSKSGGILTVMKIISLYLERSINACEDRE